MKYRVLIQPDETLCGVTCLGMICEYYGIHNISLSTIRNFAQTDREGNSIKSLCIAADKLNMNSNAVKCTKMSIINRKLKLPAIVHTLIEGLYNHYMVLFAANDEKVILGDPSQGQIEMIWEEFEKIWTNKAIMLEPTENFSENKKYKRNYRFLFNLLKKYKKQIIIMAIITTILSGVNMISTWFYSYLIDYILPENKLVWMIFVIIAISFVFIITIEFNLKKRRYYSNFNKALDKDLIINIYNRITELPISFFSMRTTADIQARYRDGDSLRSLITDFSFDFFINIAYSLWALVLVLKTNWQVLIIAIVIELSTYITQKIYQKKLDADIKNVMKTSIEVESFVMATFEANETIKNYTSEKYVENKMKEKFSKYQNEKYKNEEDIQLHSSILESIQNIGQIFILGILAAFVMDGSITLGQLVACYAYIGYLFSPMSSFIGIKEQMIHTKAVLERLDDVFNSTTEEEEDKKKQDFNEKIESIEFKNVVFQYGLKLPTLKGINFKIEKGESLGIIGESGCGKTTLIKLIMGFYNVTDGIITINDKNMNDYTKKSIREKIAYVSQNDYWFKDSIYNNLTIGKENVSQDELDKICQIVKISQYIEESPYGYNSIIEEGGTNLSSGERQRLSIAKALISKPDVLILDESTSNLDASTEEYVVKQLENDKNIIKIVVAHRLNTLINCNRIIAIKDGAIVESGTPKELLKKDGLFKELWSIQNNVISNMKKSQVQKKLSSKTSDK